ncbi:endoplasmic reticulum protein [Cryptococcus wingfieldii CBS 7118]|uniref:Endoplasmic reticulum transmembrane protein n=1 Tax=Cryptococcus wingfieldii CBS 7118 TaxID=1295528 RepID=A0A1E3JW91_9TREE|nr:endoplasmic reticulum protein [Cryptococcus wingfieldii CBS 7118]ODO05128.1 endoplasmic reticulum protein [Cryptococcus wingfieldii CBS 7118]
MTLYYSICFALLMAELGLFCTIVCPMPFALRKKMFHFLSENPIVSRVAGGLKITFIFVAVLFVDALQRMVRIAQEGATAKMKSDISDVRAETNYAARRFYAQRNLYLTGATLFLSLLLARVFYIILDFITVQESYTALQAKTAKGSGASGEETEQLRLRVQELEAKERDFETLKKQANQQNTEYGRLADEHNKATGAVSNKRVD